MHREDYKNLVCTFILLYLPKLQLFAIQGLPETDTLSLNKAVFYQLFTVPLNLDKFLDCTRSFAKESCSLTTHCVKNHPRVTGTCYLSLVDFKLEQ